MSSKHLRLATSPRIAKILSTQPEYVEATERLKRLDASARVTPPGDPHERLVTAILDNDGTVPTDILALAEKAMGGAVAWNLANDAITQARNELNRQLEAALIDQWDVILGKLHVELEEIVAEASSIRRGTHLDNADAAIAAGRVDEYQRWQALLSRHSNIRATQSQLLQADDEHFENPESFREVAFIRDVEEAFEHWPEWRRTGYLENIHDARDRKTLTPPWPLDPASNPKRLRSTDAGAPEFLTWALEHDVTLWVPTRAELADELDRVARLVRPAEPRSRSHESRPPAPTTYAEPGAPRRVRVPIDVAMDRRA